jgi:hypothetical protein
MAVALHSFATPDDVADQLNATDDFVFFPSLL